MRTVGRRSDTVTEFRLVYHEAVFVVMQRLGCGHVTLYCFSFSLVNCRHNYARFALLALVAYSFSLALIVPGLLQKQRLAAYGYSFCGHRAGVPCCRAESAYSARRRRWTKPEPAECRFAGQSDDLR